MNSVWQIDPLAAALVLSGSAVVFIVWLARVHFVTMKNNGDIIEMRAQIRQALDAVTSIERLADAVKFGSELTAQRIESLAEKLAEQHLFTKEKFAEITREMKHNQASANMVANAAARGRRKAEGSTED